VRLERLSKFKKSPHRVSNPRPSDLQHSALTTKDIHWIHMAHDRDQEQAFIDMSMNFLFP
jgi:hypothetical protein